MPLVHVTVPEGSLSDARKQLMVEKVTAAALEAEGLPNNEKTRMLTWVIINEVKEGNWGAGGGVVAGAGAWAKAAGARSASARPAAAAAWKILMSVSPDPNRCRRDYSARHRRGVKGIGPPRLLPSGKQRQPAVLA